MFSLPGREAHARCGRSGHLFPGLHAFKPNVGWSRGDALSQSVERGIAQRFTHPASRFVRIGEFTFLSSNASTGEIVELASVQLLEAFQLQGGQMEPVWAHGVLLSEKDHRGIQAASEASPDRSVPNRLTSERIVSDLESAPARGQRGLELVLPKMFGKV